MAGEVAEIKGELRQFQQHVDKQLSQFRQDTRVLFEQVKEANDAVIRTTAKLDALIGRTRDEMDALFRARNEHETRLSRIERDYKPQHACTMEMAKVDQQVQTQGQTIVGLQKVEAKAMGLAAVVSVMMGVAASLFGRWMWH